MIKTSVVLNGLEDLERALEEYRDKKVRAATKRAMKTHTERVLNTARQLVPVAEGKLKASLNAEVFRNGMGAVVKTDAKIAPHGHLVHFGSVRMGGRPFLYQAAERHENQLSDEIERELDKESL